MSRKREQITSGQIQELANAYDQCSHGPTRSRYQAVRLYREGYTAKEILAITRCSAKSLLITRSSDGQLMFLVNKLTKTKANTALGSRITVAPSIDVMLCQVHFSLGPAPEPGI